MTDPTSDRREFLRRAALAAAVTAAGPLRTGTAEAQAAAAASADPASKRPAATRTLDAALLSAVGEAVLPEALGAGARAGVVRAFGDWLARYEPVAEEMHGYGYADIRWLPPDPAPGWGAQLAGLDLLARRVHRRGFARLPVERRRALLEEALRTMPGPRLPASPLAASHVALALLAFWAATPEAHDLAYGARIGKGTCRTLATVSERPVPLDGRGAS